MNVLITGGAGYIGSHTCKAIAQTGNTPVAFDDLSTGWKKLVQWGPLIEGRIQDTDRLRKTIRDHSIEAVIHFAANSNVGESVRNPRHYFENNVGGTLSLLSALLEEGVSDIIFSSTCAVYGVPEVVPIPEDHPHRPVNPYGITKAMIESILDVYGKTHPLRWVALRYFNAAGADPESETGECHEPELHLLPRIVDVALGNRPQVEVYGTDYPTPDGSAVRDYIHVSDLAQAHVLALEYLRGGGSSTALNLGTGRGWSVLEVIRAVETVTQSSLPVTLGPRREGDPPQLVAKGDRARSLLGWTPQYSDLEHIVETDWRWRQKEH